MPYSRHASVNAREWNSAPLSLCRMPGKPATGHDRSIPRSAQPSCFVVDGVKKTPIRIKKSHVKCQGQRKSQVKRPSRCFRRYVKPLKTCNPESHTKVSSDNRGLLRGGRVNANALATRKQVCCGASRNGAYATTNRPGHRCPNASSPRIRPALNF